MESIAEVISPQVGSLLPQMREYPPPPSPLPSKPVVVEKDFDVRLLRSLAAIEDPLAWVVVICPGLRRIDTNLTELVDPNAVTLTPSFALKVAAVERGPKESLMGLEVLELLEDESRIWIKNPNASGKVLIDNWSEPIAKTKGKFLVGSVQAILSLIGRLSTIRGKWEPLYWAKLQKKEKM